MQQREVRIYRENYENLPRRFSNKIEYDIHYILGAGIPDLDKIFLFGSCARGEVRSTSDVDLLILTRDKMRDRMLAAEIRWALDEPLEGVRTDVVYLNAGSIHEKSAFKNAANFDKKILVEVREEGRI